MVHDDVDNLHDRAELQLDDAAARPRGDRGRIELLIAAGGAFAGASLFDRCDAAWAEALAEARELGDPVLEARLLVEQAGLAQVRDPHGVRRYHAIAATLRPVLEEAHDELGLYRLHQHAARAFAVQDETLRAREEAALALEHARRAEYEDVYCTYLLAEMDLHGAAPVEDVMRRARELLPRGRGLTWFALGALALGNAMLGDRAEARRLVDEHAEFGLNDGKSTATELEGEVELVLGDAVAAEQAVRRVVETQEREGDLGHGSGSVAVLARAVLEQGRREEALELLAKLERWAAPDDVRAQSQLLALRGRATGEAALVRAAVELLEPTERLNDRARSLLDLHAVTAERTALERALELYGRKGNRVAAARVVTALHAGAAEP